MNLNHAKTFNKDMMLAWFLHHMRSEQRCKLIRALPEAYNDVVQLDVALVVHKDDLTPVGEPL